MTAKSDLASNAASSKGHLVYRQICLRWNLDPSMAAMWRLASQEVGQDSIIKTSWVEIDNDQSSPQQLPPSVQIHQGIRSLDFPPAAIVVGIDHSNFRQIVREATKIRTSCCELRIDREASDDAFEWTTFLLGWFPGADRQAICLLIELGFDLVLYDPTTLRSVLRRVAQYGFRACDGRA